MAHARPIRDVRRGDIWVETADQSQVIIVGAGNHYVEFMRAGGTVEVPVYAKHFLKRFAPLNYYPEAISSQFLMSVANLVTCHIFWCPMNRRRIFARSTARAPQDSYAAARGSPPLPKTAIYVGTYSHPFPADQFLGDLDAVIAKLNRKASRAGTEPTYAFA